MIFKKRFSVTLIQAIFILNGCFFTTSCFAWQDKLTVLASDISVGNHPRTGQPLTATSFTMPDNVFRFNLDTATGLCTVQLRGIKGEYYKSKGSILQYNFKSKRVLWDKPINYSYEHLLMGNNLLLSVNQLSTYRLNAFNGNVIWDYREPMIFHSIKHELGFVYSNGGSGDKLRAINLQTGKEAWTRKIAHDFGWNDLYNNNDTSLLISSSGLHQMNPKTGLGWDYEAETGRKNYTKAVLTTLAGTALGLLTGTGFYSTGADVVTGLASNVLQDSANAQMYYASKEKLVCLNNHGKPNWSYSLPKDVVSQSYLFKHDSTLQMLNFGVARKKGEMIPYGRPFIANFNLSTGKLSAFNFLNTEEQPIVDQIIRKDTLIILFRDSILKYSLSNNSVLSFNAIKLPPKMQLKQFVGSNVYVSETDSTVQMLTKTDTTAYFITLSDEKMIKLAADLQALEYIEPQKLYYANLKAKNHQLLYAHAPSKEAQSTWIVDEQLRVKNKVKLTVNIVVMGDKLFEVKGKQVIMYNVNELFDIE
jgi:outer membrane protein assembly factor BamB